MFLQALDNRYNNEWCHMLIDMVAISLVSDSMDMSDIQNRFYYHHGIETIWDIFNPFLQATFERFIGKNAEYTQRDIAFKIVPKFNSVIRSDNNELKQQVIQGFIGINKNFSDILSKCDECHKNQIKLLDTIIDNNKEKIEQAQNNNIVLLSCDDMPRSYSGLVAGKIMNICNKPTIVGKIKDNKLIGSLRSPIPLRNDLNENDLVEWAFGHENSCGISIEEKNIEKLVEYYNSLNLSYEPCIDVLRSYSIKDIPKTICGLFGDNLNVLWGYGLPKPLFEVHDIIYYPSDIQILGSNSRTLKLINNGISFIIFNATKQQKADLGLGCIIDGEYYERDNLSDTKYCLSCIGNLSINRYKHFINNQMIIDRFNVKPYKPKTVANIFGKR
jgi:single-stranded DNA-specific DHH superfamily exonuclease